MKHEMEVAAPGEREIAMVRDFDAPRHSVWDAWTRPEIVRRWLTGPDGWMFVVCEIDLRVDGAYRFVWRNPEGRKMAMSGAYREVAAPERLVNTQRFEEDWTGGEAIGTLVLVPRGERTRATNTVRYASRVVRDGMLVAGMTDGVAFAYERLDRLLASIGDRNGHPNGAAMTS
jgi:uncharacterized protein YndB with AHSA1/START domain